MTGQIDARLENHLSDSTDLINLLSQKVVGQSSATDGELTLCAERNFPILFKPFLAQDILSFIRGAYRRTFAAGAGSISTAESKIRTDSV